MKEILFNHPVLSICTLLLGVLSPRTLFVVALFVAIVLLIVR